MRVEIQEKELFKSLIYQNFNMKLNTINGICTDSREVKKGDVFIPIKGEQLDPHQFIPNVIEKKPSIIFSEIKFQNKNIIKVKSTKNTLKNLSSDWVEFFKAPIIAITGSNGKTTTKEMLNNIFSSVYKTNYTRGNYNSSIGLPINLFEFCLDANVSILEMGANKADEIDYLCQIAKPHYSLITNIQNAHIGNFNSFNDLINTKISIFKNTNINGKIFENLDDINIMKNSNGVNQAAFESVPKRNLSALSKAILSISEESGQFAFPTDFYTAGFSPSVKSAAIAFFGEPTVPDIGLQAIPDLPKASKGKSADATEKEKSESNTFLTQ